ncbi:MAG: GNAT family N-acetyltransferase [Mariprofundus sp.]|nr:GNAT family N-acetyltransferase [Mariprofundus sp.]
MTALFIVRRAEPDDASAIVNFNRAHALEVEGRALKDEASRCGVEAVFADSAKGCYYVVESDETLIGVLLITYEWSDWRNSQVWWIQSVYVTPFYRSSGAFKTLFSFVEQQAKLAHCCELKLYVVHDNNRAIAAYSKRGLCQSKYVIYEKELA